MIDRKAFRIFLLLLVAMVAGAAWLLSLPDWRSPAGGHDVVEGLTLFLMPACLLLFLVSPLIQWLLSPGETRPSLKRLNGKVIVAWAVFWTVLQAFILARSLDLVTLSNLGIARGGSVMIGVIFMIFGNFVPKTPVPSRGDGPPADSWRTSRQLRLLGKLFVGLGLAFVLGGILLPLRYWEPVFLSLMLAAFAAAIAHGIGVRHEWSR